MRKDHLIDELREIRMAIWRLEQREVELRQALAGGKDVAAMAPRPGWPIRRDALH